VAAERAALTQDEVERLDLEELVGYNLRRAHGVQQQRFRSVFGPFSIRPVQLSMLALVHQNPGIKQSELGRQLSVKRANIVTLLSELEERRLLRRRPAEGDRRSYVIELTPAGARLTVKLLKMHERLEEDMAQGLGVRDRAELVRLLKKFRRLNPEPEVDEND
jgi:DNA-binding MarR family transcriptional regulator